MSSKLKGKVVKDYTFGDALAIYEENVEVIKGMKGEKIPVAIFSIFREKVDAATFPAFNDQIVKNLQCIYPAYYEIVQSQNFIYMIFEDLIQPQGSNPQKLAYQLQKLLFNAPMKLSRKEIFQKNDQSLELCVIPAYSKNMGHTSNLYSKFHNKSILSDLFVEALDIPGGKKKDIAKLMVESFEEQTLWNKLEEAIFGKKAVEQKTKSVYHHHQQQQPQQPHQSVMRSQFMAPKSSMFNKQSIMKEAEIQYPSVDDEQYEELMNAVRVNPSLKQEAGEAFMRQSSRARHEQKSNMQISSIFQNMKSSVFDMKYEKQKNNNSNKGASKVQIKLNEKKAEKNSFEVYYEAYCQIFDLFKKTIQSYLKKYKIGFAGIISAYLLTLIGMLKRLQLYKDLSLGIDVFDIGKHISGMNFSHHMISLKKQLVKEARILVNLKSVIENTNLPIKTYEALEPYLQEEIELVDEEELRKFCFFFLTILMKMDKNSRSYHDNLALETMYILINGGYEIIFSKQTFPNDWSPEHFQLQKTLISASYPQWQI